MQGEGLLGRRIGRGGQASSEGPAALCEVLVLGAFDKRGLEDGRLGLPLHQGCVGCPPPVTVDAWQ